MNLSTTPTVGSPSTGEVDRLGLKNFKKEQFVNNRKAKILVFSPYAGIWPHQLQQTQLLKKYNFSDYEIIVVSCGGLLNRHCAVYESFGREFDKKEQDQICKKCGDSSRLTTKSLGVEEIKLVDYITTEEKSERLQLADAILVSELSSFKFNDLDIGRLTAFETFIKYKKNEFSINQIEMVHWKNGIYQGLLAQLAGERIIDVYGPDLVLSYSPQYAASAVFAAVCNKKSIPVYFMEGSVHLGERFEALQFWNWETHGLIDPAIESFKLNGKSFETERDINRINQHLKITEQSRSFGAYSVKKQKKYDVFADFDIPKEMKVVLCTLSSTDEIFSGYVIGKIPLSHYEGRVFRTQFDWIHETIELAKKHQNIFFIIRLHPRMVSNRRENVVSPEVEKWRKLLNVLPQNVAVDYPEFKRSVSGYFDQIDLLITGWSSTAIDAMAIGVPALSFDAAVSWFPPEVVYACTDENEYEVVILQKLQEGRNENNRVLAFAWLNHRLIKGTIPVPGRLIDRLHLNNIKIFEKMYGFVTKYTLIVVAGLEIVILPRKKQSIPIALSKLLNGESTSLH